jgi:recombination protein RecT
MTQEKPVTALAQVCQGLQKMQPNFAQALPKGLSPDKFIRTATNAIQMHPQRNALLAADRQSLYNACQKAAIDGLMLDGREAALVVFSGQATYMPMTQGLVKLARNSGEIANIIAEVVYEKDKFVYRIGTDAIPVHEPDWFADDRGQPVGAWALIKLTNGEFIHALLPKAKIMKIASKSKNGYQYEPSKGLYFDEWWKKTAIKNVLKYAPKSTELERAIEREEKAEFGLDEEIVIDQPAPEPKPARKTKVSEAVKEQVKPEPDLQEDIIDIEFEEDIPV